MGELSRDALKGGFPLTFQSMQGAGDQQGFSAMCGGHPPSNGTDTVPVMMNDMVEFGAGGLHHPVEKKKERHALRGGGFFFVYLLNSFKNFFKVYTSLR